LYFFKEMLEAFFFLLRTLSSNYQIEVDHFVRSHSSKDNVDDPESDEGECGAVTLSAGASKFSSDENTAEYQYEEAYCRAS
jgi:hypothetical protein